MKKRVFFTLSGIIILAASCMVISGFHIETSAYITDDFSVSDDESELTFKVGVASSMGFVRGYKDDGGGDKPHYLKFYSAFHFGQAS